MGSSTPLGLQVGANVEIVGLNEKPVPSTVTGVETFKKLLNEGQVYKHTDGPCSSQVHTPLFPRNFFPATRRFLFGSPKCQYIP
jgi:hypothetical protein